MPPIVGRTVNVWQNQKVWVDPTAPASKWTTVHPGKWKMVKTVQCTRTVELASPKLNKQHRPSCKLTKINPNNYSPIRKQGGGGRGSDCLRCRIKLV